MLHLFPVEKTLASAIGIGTGTIIATIDAMQSPAPSYLRLLVEGGMAAIVIILLIRVLPETLSHIRKIHQDARDSIRENNESNLEAQEQMLARFEAHDTRWAKLLETRGYCPVRDNHHVSLAVKRELANAANDDPSNPS